MIGRDRPLFADAVARNAPALDDAIGGARILVHGGAGSIGKEVVRQIFMRRPAALHVVDISENNLTELVRDLRSSLGYIAGDTRFLPIDMGSIEARAFLADAGDYDYVVNLAAMKHVRSEKDAFSLMRMVKTNILDTLATLDHARRVGARKYFAVSTDKAKNPANLMGATKRIMELALFADDAATPISTARFANVAFSDGSLLHGFRQRLQARQPISAPLDIKRYFVTGEEAGQLCLLSIALGAHREIFFPDLDAGLDLLTFSDIAERFVRAHGYEPERVASEDEARGRAEELIAAGRWPCHFFASDTDGEKPFEEFYSDEDSVDFDRFADVGVIAAPEPTPAERESTAAFLDTVRGFRDNGAWTKDALAEAIATACPDLAHVSVGKTLDNRM